jgi:hypothetical protein
VNPRCKNPTREQWLQAAASELTGWIGEHWSRVVPRVWISVGWPQGGEKAHRIGECWAGSKSADGRCHIFIAPDQVDGTAKKGLQHILETLLHEMIHATVGVDCGHRGNFAKAARACGLGGKMTATEIGTRELQVFFNRTRRKLGTYPHAKLRRPPPRGKRGVGSRLRLYECKCPIKIRVARDPWDFDATCNMCGTDFERQS